MSVKKVLLVLLIVSAAEMQFSPPASPEADRYQPAELAAGDLRYGTYLGGAAADRARALAIGPDGDIYLAGETASDDLPTTPGASQLTQRGNDDVFVARLTSSNGACDFQFSLWDAASSSTQIGTTHTKPPVARGQPRPARAARRVAGRGRAHPDGRVLELQHSG